MIELLRISGSYLLTQVILFSWNSRNKLESIKDYD